MTTQPDSEDSFDLLDETEIKQLLELDPRFVTPLTTDLPSRRPVPTYLDHLDKHLRGGWSWQWPLVIAGPPDGGKSLLVYQLIASSLLSFPSPWKIFYCDLAGDFRPDRIQKILSWRTQATTRQYQLGRVDKVTLRSKRDFPRPLSLNMGAPDLGLLVIDAFEHFNDSLSFPKALQLLTEFGRRRRVGIIVTIRGSINEIRPQILWSKVPFFLYISRKQPLIYRLRVWHNGSKNKIYDRLLKFHTYFQECRWWKPQ